MKSSKHIQHGDVSAYSGHGNQLNFQRIRPQLSIPPKKEKEKTDPVMQKFPRPWTWTDIINWLHLPDCYYHGYRWGSGKFAYPSRPSLLIGKYIQISLIVHKTHINNCSHAVMFKGRKDIFKKEVIVQEINYMYLSDFFFLFYLQTCSKHILDGKKVSSLTQPTMKCLI